MKVTRFIIALVICVSVLSCGKNTSIIGRWKQVEDEPYDSVTNYKAESLLVISADSSFTCNYGTDEKGDTSFISGWHAGLISGKWAIKEKNLELRLDPDTPMMIFNYEILKLTGKELELIFSGWKNSPDAKSLRYTRL